MEYNFDSIFPRYEEFNPLVPVWCVTPDMDGVIHRFFDTSPISPSGRFLAITKFPSEDKLPEPGEYAQIIIVDLITGKWRVVAHTMGWDTQLGAQLQWGKDDTQLFFNDVDPLTWKPFGIEMNPISCEKRNVEGTVYMTSNDGKRLLSPCLLKIGETQAGYGVIVPHEHITLNNGAPSDDGIYITYVDNGKKELLISLKKIVEKIQPSFKDINTKTGDFYIFHVKWNSKADRILFVLRFKYKTGKCIPYLITMKDDGTEICLTIPENEWGIKGGHHPNWCPDGEHIIMNLNYYGDGMRIVKARYDGSGYGPIDCDFVGSGHPTLHPNGRTIVTDAYTHEPLSYGDGTTPIRIFDLNSKKEDILIRIRTQPIFSGHNNELRVDPHPAWDYSNRYIVFNACPQGRRTVFIADLSRFL